ncbi:hypothetical protein D3C77_765630 [compost metagenome]
MNHPEKSFDVIDIGLEAGSYREACEEAIKMVMNEEGLQEDELQYLSIGIVTEPN